MGSPWSTHTLSEGSLRVWGLSRLRFKINSICCLRNNQSFYLRFLIKSTHLHLKRSTSHQSLWYPMRTEIDLSQMFGFYRLRSWGILIMGIRILKLRLLISLQLVRRTCWRERRSLFVEYVSRQSHGIPVCRPWSDCNLLSVCWPGTSNYSQTYTPS